ncbi:MAG TPA: hypothetical protein VGM54_13475 [Chthoniobacter sp.]|jgi:outer membrane protein TolC
MKTQILLLSVFLGSLPLLADDTKPAPGAVDGFIDYGSPIVASMTKPVAGPSAQAAIEAIVKQRISVLTEIVGITKTQYAAGEATEVELLDATLELYTLNRDASKTLAGQISWQKRIVETARQKEACLEHERSAGTAGSAEVLHAKEQVLAAEQKQLELTVRK